MLGPRPQEPIPGRHFVIAIGAGIITTLACVILLPDTLHKWALMFAVPGLVTFVTLWAQDGFPRMW